MFFLMSILASAVIYTMYAYMSFHGDIKNSAWFIPTGTLLAVLGNVLWLIYAQKTDSQQLLLTRGIIWDLMISASFIITPFIFFDMKINKVTLLGLGITIIGILVLKSGETFFKG